MMTVGSLHRILKQSVKLPPLWNTLIKNRDGKRYERNPINILSPAEIVTKRKHTTDSELANPPGRAVFKSNCLFVSSVFMRQSNN